jgi:hypothetical protein
MSNRMPIDEEVAVLGDFSREELAERWTKAYGHPPPKGARRDFLLRVLPPVIFRQAGSARFIT